jgi:hypothetical protein
MESIVVIFLLAYGFAALVHAAVHSGGEADQEEAKMISGIVITVAWFVAIARLVSLAQYPH